MTSQPYYTLKCSRSAPTCHYVSILDPQQSKKIVKQFSDKSIFSENFRSKKGRKILGSKIKSKDPSRSLDLKQKRKKSYPNVNYIPYGLNNFPGRPAGKTKIDLMRNKEILRPEVKFTSNAKPAMLKWRELEIEATQIMPPSGISKKYKSRPIHNHVGYSRNLVGADESPLPNIIRQNARVSPISSTAWLPTPSYVNGLPKTMFHFKFPQKFRILNSGSKTLKHVHNENNM